MAIGLAASLALVPVAPRADAAVIRDFTKLYSAQINGSIQITGNTLLSCTTTVANCPAARAGTVALGNNDFVMSRVDADADSSTTSSSSADVTLPAGSTVARAYLFWGANTAPTGTASTIRFRTPAGGYQTLTSDGRDSTATDYSAYKDVTSLLRAGGSGTYWGADIPLAAGATGQYAGWSLVIAIADPNAPLRDLSIFSGYATVGVNNPASASISGFLTPPTGTVVSKVGVVMYEGDLQYAGDQFLVNGVAQSDGSAGSTTNFANSRVAADGTLLTNRGPAYANSMGVDAKTFSTTSIPNNATSATLQFNSTNDVYYPAALTTQVDLYAPTINGQKTATNLTRSGTAQVGDLLEYTMSFTNTGDDNATNAVARDVLPAGVQYVPGSIQVTAGPNAGAKTDATGDDVAEYLAASRTVRVRLGTGANATTGGTLAKNVTSTVKFRATLVDASAGTSVDNVAQLDYRAPQIGRDYTYSSATNSTPVTARADLAITKTASPTAAVAGSPLTYTLTVTNNGENTAANATVSDTLPSGLTLTSATPSSGTCTGTSTVTCTLGDIPSGATRTITLLTQVQGGFGGSSLTNVASVSSDVGDPVPGNNTASVSTPVSRAADVRVTKTVSPAAPAPGQDVTYTVEVTNDGPSNAAAVNLADTLPGAFLTTPAPTATITGTSGATCTVAGRAVSCGIGTLTPGQTATVTILARLGSGYAGGAVSNTATASTSTTDPNPANNSSTATFTPGAAQADLAVTKTTTTSPVVPGAPVQYQITVTNNGPSDAPGVTVTDAPPGALSGLTATPSQGTCATATSCALGTLTPGSSATITVNGLVAAGATGSLTNSATATSGATDPTPGNNTASTTDILQPRADVAITKTAGPAVTGANVNYTVTVTNNGPSTAQGVQVTDPIPAPLSFVSISSSQGTCTGGTNAQCSLGSLAPGASATVTIVARTPSDGSGNGAVNTATVSTSTTDPTPGNNSASHTLTTGAQANVSLSKSAAPAQLVAGGPVTFTLTAHNDGPSNANGVSITDTLPDNVAIGTLPAGCTRAGQTVTCTRATLAAGADFTVQIPGTLAATTPAGTLTNTATVGATGPVDPSPSDNTATSTSPVVTRADLSLTKTGPARVVAGDVVEYTLSVTNAGQSEARDVMITDQLPAGTAFVSSPDCALQSGSTTTAECSLGTLAPGATRTTTLRVRVPAGQADSSSVTNSAQVSSSTTDPTPGNNTASASTAIDTRTDLAVTKRVQPSPLLAGQRAVYTVTVTNNGPSDARGITVTDTLPTGVSLVDASTPAGSCSGTTTVTCQRPLLAAGDTWTITIRVAVGADTTTAQVNRVVVSSSTTETAPGDNSFDLTSPVTSAADLAVVKTVQPNPVAPGRQVSYGLTVVNNGPATATGTTLTDPLPAGLSGATVTLAPASAGTCTITGGALDCALGAVAPGTPITATVTALLDAGYTGTDLVNTATVASNVSDPTPGNNSSTATAAVVAESDVAVVKRADTATVVAGEAFQYTLEAANGGPSVARGVVVTDDVPAALTILSATVGGTACSVTGQQISCPVGTLAPGASALVVVRVRPAADLTATSIENTGRVTSTTDDPNSANNADTLTLPVTAAADVRVTKTRTVPASGPVVPGERVTWTVTVSNPTGPSAARGVTLDDPVDPSLTGVTATGAGGGCSVAATNRVTCTIGRLDVGDSVTVTISGIVPADRTTALSNTATASATTADPAGGNNSATVTDPVTARAAVSIAKQRTSGPVVPGQDVTWQITVTNAGPSIARAVTITDDVADALTGVTATVSGAPGATCSVGSGNLVSCALGDLPAGTATVTVSGTVPAGFTGSLDNTATVASPTDTTPGDNSATSSGTAQPSADLAITKTRTSGPVVPGQDVTWQITVTNGGPSVATGVVVTDDVIDALTGVTATATAGTCTVTNGGANPNLVRCDLGDVAPGASITLTVSGRVPADYTGAVGNTASVSATTPDPVAANNTATVGGTAQPAADVSITKTRTSGPIVPGSDVAWSITVSNAGPSSATGVTVSDDLLDALTGVTVNAPGSASCAVGAGNTVACTLPDLAPGQSVSLTVRGALPAGYTGSVDNTATVSSPTDTTPGNNTATSTGTAAPAADVSITKTRTSGPIVPGRAVTWSVVVTNAGPSVARNVVVSDDLVDALTGVSASASGGTTCDVAGGNQVTCTVGDLAPGASVTITVTGSLPAGYTGSVDNTATVSSPTDSTPGNNTATSTGTAAPAADVSITKTRTSGPVVPGQPVTWSVVVTNSGPSTARGVTVSDDVIDALTGVSASASGGATCTVGTGNQIDCDLGDVAPGGSVTITVTGSLPAGYTGSVDNTATVSSPTDSTPGNNTATSTGTAAPAADVSITKTRTSGPVVPGQDVTWSVVVTNSGPSTARAVTVSDDVIDALTGVSASAAGGATCTVGTGNQVTCTVGDLAPGATVTITVTGSLPAGYTGSVDNTATVTSPTDTTPGNNTATSTGTAAPAADVSITKTRTSGPVVPGQDVTWSVVVTNSGPSTARAVTVSDDVIDALTGVSASAAGGATCTVGTGNQVTCTVGDLAPGATVTITVTGSLPAGYTGSVDNTATVTSPTDTTPGNNTATSTGTAQPQADVSITKTRTSGPVVPGQPVTWRVTVVNDGPSVARAVTVADDAIDALTGLTATATGGTTCTVAAGNQVTCTIGDLAPGSSTTITITGSLPAGYTGALDNTATVTSPTDTTPDNNSATSTGTAQPHADVSITKTRTSGTPIPGRPISWDIVVTNSGPSVARDVTVADDAVDALTGLTATATVGTTCDVAAGNQVTCTIGDLAPGSSTTITITGSLPAGYTGTLDNTATVTSPTDTTPDNNTATSTGTAQPQADVTVAKTRTSGPVVAGQPVSWQVTVTNNGPSVARQVTISDAVEPALTGVTATLAGAPAGAACTVAADNQVACSLGDLPATEPGRTVVLTLTADVPAGFTGTLDNTATIASPTDTTPSNNTATSPGDVDSIADLSIVKARVSGPAIPGRSIEWTLTVDNAGPSNATQVVVDDDVLDAFTGVTATTTTPGVACTVAAGNQVSCDLGTVTPSQAPVVITVRAMIPAGYTGSVANTATVDSNPADGNPTDNTSTAGGTAGPEADVSIAKTRTSGPVVPGQDVSWSVVVANGGPSTARDVTVADDVIDALTGVTATATGGATCTIAAGNQITCDLGDLAPGDTVTITVTGTVPAGFTGAADNTATVSSPTDTTPGNNSATSSGTAQPEADVSIAKTRTSGPVVPGRDVTWRITVANDGPSVARDVTVADDVIDALTGVTATSPGATCTVAAGNQIACDLGQLAPGDSVTITVTGSVPAGYTGTADNTATVSSPTDSTPDDNSATSTGTAQPEADVSIAKTRTSGTPIPGMPIGWQIQVSNAGPSVARNVTVADDAIDALTGVTATATGGATCTVGSGNQIDCDLGDLAPGSTVTITVSGSIPAGFTGAVGNTATVSSPTDTTPDNNSATSGGTAQPEADVSIAKTRTSGPIVPGQDVTWSIVASNSGPSVARDVTVADDVVDALTGVTATATGGTTCTIGSGNQITCDLGDLAPGSTVTITITGSVPAGFTGALDNTATVSSPTDSTPGNNTATSTGSALPEADVSIAKTRTSGPVVPGQDVTWRITVTNDGPSVARDVAVADDVVDALTGVTATATGGTTCTVAAGNQIACDLGDLAPGSTVTITITGSVPAGITGALDNTATVSSPTDTTPGNNSATSSGTAQPDADVSITKTRTSGAPTPGRPIGWDVVVTNSGPSVARDVTVADDVIDALTGVTATATGGATCTVATENQVTCDLGDLAPGSSITVTISGELPAGYTGTVDNTATVSSPTDTTPGNNTATSTGSAQPQADVSIAKVRTSGPVVAGQDVTWRITVENTGPSTAQGVTVADDVNDALTGVTATATGGATCTVGAGNQVDCDLGDLAPGSTVSITVTGSVPADFTGALDNTATVDSPTDSTPGNNEATSAGTGGSRVDLAITKTLDREAVPGQAVSWTLEVGNDGPSVAHDVVVSDQVPATVGDVTATGPTGVTCTVVSGLVTCTLDEIAPGATVSIQVGGLLGTDVRGDLVNAAEVTSSDIETAPGDNSATSTEPVGPRADLGLTKTVDPQAPLAGGPVTFTLTVTNAGPSTSTGAVVTDPLASQIRDPRVSATPGTDCSLGSDRVVTCAVADLAPGATAVITVRGTIAPGTTGPLTNTASVAPGAEIDPDPADNEATIVSDDVQGADVQIVKDASKAEVTAGDRLDYQLSVTNAGPAVARDMVVTDELPDGLTAERATVPGAGRSCSITAGGGLVTCELGDLAADAEVTITLSVAVADDARGRIVNGAEVSSSTADPTADNNDDSVAVDVEPATSPGCPDCPGPGPDGPDHPGGPDLPDTGADASLTPLALTGLFALLLGGWLLLRSRRRRS